MIPEAQLVAKVLLVCVALVGAYTDYRWRKLPNWLTLGGSVVGLGLGLLSGGLDGGRDSLFGWLLGCGLLFVFFALGAMGAGDVKFLAAVGALQGTRFVFNTFVFMAIIGGVMAIVMLVYRGEMLRLLRSTGRWIWLAVRGMVLYRSMPSLGGLLVATPGGQSVEATPANGKGKRIWMPYGVAIAGGAIAALLLGY